MQDDEISWPGIGIGKDGEVPFRVGGGGSKNNAKVGNIIGHVGNGSLVIPD